MIERLPSETCKLYNLQFLLLSGCKRLTELSERLENLLICATLMLVKLH
jgi:hypothetical protein